MRIHFLIWIITTVSILPAIAQDRSNEKKQADLPLKGTRALNIHTTEGTWLSLDISPDGKTIIFDMLGDLYQLPISGGEAKPLTTGMPMDTQARYSPDGKSIVFISDRDGANNVWTMNLATKETRQITKSRHKRYQSAVWTPDGDYIIAAQGTGVLKLHMYHKDGGSGIGLTKKPAIMKDIEPAFSTNSRYIWFSRRKGMWEYNAQLPQFQLYIYDRQTGSVTKKTNRQGSAFTPTLSPDGKWLVYGTRYNAQTGLIALNLETKQEKWLAYPVQHDEQESLASMGVLPSMAFTPDSKFLIASYGGKIYKLPIAGGEAIEIPFEVETTMQVGPKLDFEYPVPDDSMMTVTQIRDPEISPDGKKIVFSALDHLYIMDYPNGTPERLTETDNITEAQPAWSPDGRYIVYAGWDEQGGGALYKVGGNGKNAPQRLFDESGIYRDPVWSPSGEKIVFRMSAISKNYSSGTGNFDADFGSSLNWIPADGGTRQVISTKDVGIKPHFIQGKDRIYLYKESEGLISLRWDGTDKKNHIKVKGRHTYNFKSTSKMLPTSFDFKKQETAASLVVKAPVGDKALALIGNEVYIVTVPFSGGETPTVTVADVENANFPSWKLTEIGGEFPTWSADGKTVYWSLGHTLFAYSLDELETKNYAPAKTKVNVEVPRDIPQGSTLLKGARIITMNEGKVIEKGDILIVNNKIEAIGKTNTLEVPANTKRIDVKGKTIIPGFIGTHDHMWPRWDIHTNQVWRYAANLAYGVTTTRDPQTSTTDVLTYTDQVEAGNMLGPRIYSTGPGIAMWSYNLQSLEHTRKVLRQYSEYYDTQYIKMYLAGNRQQRQWVIMAAKEQKLMPTTEGGLDFKLNITEILDGYPGHEHAYTVFPIYKDFLEATSQSQIAYTPTLLVDYNGPFAENYYFETEDLIGNRKLSYFIPKPILDSKIRRRSSWFAKEEYVFDEKAKFINELVKNGGIVGVGSHGQFQGLGYHWELWSVQSGGMSPHNALKAATLLGAKALGLDHDLGSLEIGKLADLVVLDKNPLKDIRNTNTIRYVMSNGRLYDAETLQPLAPIKGKVPQFDWHHDKPENLPGIYE